MKMEHYELNAGLNLTEFEFISEGDKGKIVKLVQYKETSFTNIYNLAFGDKDLVTGSPDDQTITNNGDKKKVLATVAATVYLFLNRHPYAWVYATGSTQARTRLYRMGITTHLNEISSHFEVYGLINNKWKEFKRETTYEAFLVRKKL